MFAITFTVLTLPSLSLHLTTLQPVSELLAGLIDCYADDCALEEVNKPHSIRAACRLTMALSARG